jgi:hypothetical protein
MASQLFQEEGIIAMNMAINSGKHRHRRTKRRELFCPKHPEQKIEGNGKKYFLHLLSPEDLRARGMSDKKAKLVINAYPVLVLSNEWLEELFCPQCGTSSWCHVKRHDRISHSVSWAPRELWMQVAHVDPLMPNPSVSEYTRRTSRQLTQKRIDGKRFWDR